MNGSGETDLLIFYVCRRGDPPERSVEWMRGSCGGCGWATHVEMGAVTTAHDVLRALGRPHLTARLCERCCAERLKLVGVGCGRLVLLGSPRAVLAARSLAVGVESWREPT